MRCVIMSLRCLSKAINHGESVNSCSFRRSLRLSIRVRIQWADRRNRLWIAHGRRSVVALWGNKISVMNEDAKGLMGGVDELSENFEVQNICSATVEVSS